MLAPHWLDDVFADPDKAKEALLESERFAEAMKRALKALEKQPVDTQGPTPAQAARVAFLETLATNQKEA